MSALRGGGLLRSGEQATHRGSVRDRCPPSQPARGAESFRWVANSTGARALEFCVDTRVPEGCIAGTAVPVAPENARGLIQVHFNSE